MAVCRGGSSVLYQLGIDQSCLFRLVVVLAQTYFEHQVRSVLSRSHDQDVESRAVGGVPMSLPPSPSLSSAHGIFLPLQPPPLTFSRPVSPLSPRPTPGQWVRFSILSLSFAASYDDMIAVIITAAPVSHCIVSYCVHAHCLVLPLVHFSLTLNPLGHSNPVIQSPPSAPQRVHLTPDCFLFCFFPRLFFFFFFLSSFLIFPSLLALSTSFYLYFLANGLPS